MLQTAKRVVVTGMGVISSIGVTIPHFKQALLDKRCGIKPSEQFVRYFNDANASEVLTPIAYQHLDQQTIDTLDKGALWAYQVGMEALTDSGLQDDPLTQAATLIIGVSSAGTEAFIPLIEGQTEQFSLQKLFVSGSFASCSASVASLLGIQGGFELVATACTASTNALGMGFDFIQSGQNSTAVIIGTEPVYIPTFAGFYTLNAMKRSPTSPFSGETGMSIGEGAGALVIEEYEQAVARGATIYGEILSYATSGDAYHETAPDPRADGAVRVMRNALANAGLSTDSIDYINAHGTGTDANDRCETLAMKKVFPNIMQIPVSSTKSYFGHNIGAAGIMELIACFLMLAEQKILPTLNFSTPRINCDLNYVPNDFQQANVDVFMKNNYAFGGNNCCVIASMQVGQTPLAEKTRHRVAITGRGAVTAMGHDISSMMDNIWQDKKRWQDLVQPIHLAIEQQQQLSEFLQKLEHSVQVDDYLQQRWSKEQLKALFTQPAGLYHIDLPALQPYLRRFDARKADPINIFSLLAVTQTLQNAKRKIKRDGERLGLIMGVSKGPHNRISRYLNSLMPDPTKARTSEFPGSLMNAVATYCSIAEGIKGYNTTLATGVNAALGALTYGYELVKQGAQPQVLVGGADENIHPFSLYLQALQGDVLLSHDSNDFQMYGKQPKGYLNGEGACLLFLEDAQLARQRGATIYAQIVGYGKSNAIDYFARNDVQQRINALQQAISKALTQAQLSAEQIDLICGSSYGTAVGDTVELMAIKQALPQHYQQIPLVNYTPYFGVVESVVGLLNLQMVIEVMQRQQILPIPGKHQFAHPEFAFVTEKIDKAVRYALVLGGSEIDNYYAIIIAKGDDDDEQHRQSS